MIVSYLARIVLLLPDLSTADTERLGEIAREQKMLAERRADEPPIDIISAPVLDASREERMQERQRAQTVREMGTVEVR